MAGRDITEGRATRAIAVELGVGTGTIWQNTGVAYDCALAGIPLVVIDVSICYWILTNLQQTMRTLRVRRNLPKLTLYRHFTNTLIFCVIGN